MPNIIGAFAIAIPGVFAIPGILLQFCFFNLIPDIAALAIPGAHGPPFHHVPFSAPVNMIIIWREDYDQNSILTLMLFLTCDLLSIVLGSNILLR